ncbi:coiled-coil domain-containing protein 89-like [Elysia marginata]|uniref:Coiled-coil domain-containing protein 89-like n=1 Tax=Elysia marginata TaxID=1093978 RepID=A0AAV4ILJ5_9GAST|nr:coiled-coil domain-containing protein 89-like [Elysia marginata]
MDMFEWKGLIELALLKKTSLQSTIEHCKSIFSRYGIPQTFFSNNGPQFASCEFAQFSVIHGFEHRTSSPRHPQGNGYYGTFHIFKQKEQEENKTLKKKIEDMQKTVQDMEDRFNREAEAVNANVRVKRLTENLSDADTKYSHMVKEFEAFKKHSSDLLKREKELNDRLRALYS